MAARATHYRTPTWLGGAIHPLAGAVIAVAAMAGGVLAQPAPAPGPRPIPLRPKLSDPAAQPVPATVDTPAEVVVRPVVGVVDLRADADSKSLAGAIAAAIGGRPELAAVSNADVAAALVGPLADEDTRALKDARQLLDEARALIGEYDLDLAVDRAARGVTRLLGTTPAPASTKLVADLVFAEGQAEFANQHTEQARMAFALVHRLQPGKVLGPGEYPPKLGAAFAAAAEPVTETATVEVVATGTVWLDGQPQGEGGRSMTVPPGSHIIVASGRDHLPAGTRVLVVPGQVLKIQLTQIPAPPELHAQRARKALIAAPDPTARAAAIKQIADITRMTDAVIITADPKGEPAIQLWRNRAPGFGEIKPVKRPLSVPAADDLLLPLLPPKPPVELGPDLQIPFVPAEEPKAWWQKRWVQVGIVGGVVALIAGSYALSNAFGADDRGFMIDGVSGSARD